MLDFHAHILPGVDDGSKSVDESTKMLEQMQAQGIKCVVATPHFYANDESVDTFLARRAAAYEAVAHLPNRPKILLGAEVQLCKGLENLEQLPELCYEGTNVLLLELPPMFSPKQHAHTLECLLYECDLTVVLAHVDRYDTNLIDGLLSQGFLAQLNASAFCHFMSKRAALRRVKDGSVCALGSDLHGTKTGYTEFLRAKKVLGSGYDEIMQSSRALLNL